METSDAADIVPPTGRYVPRRAVDVAAVDVDGEAVVFHEGTDRVHLLNPTATLLWSLLDGVGSVDELSAELAEAFGTPFDVVRRDVLAGVAELVRDGLVHDATDLGEETARESHGSGVAAPEHPTPAASSSAEDRVLAEPPDT